MVKCGIKTYIQWMQHIGNKQLEFLHVSIRQKYPYNLYVIYTLTHVSKPDI